jgi:MSHA biogenesis protein MshQ
MGTQVSGQTSVVISIHAAVAAGDKIVLIVGDKDATPVVIPATPANYTQVGTHEGGTGSFGADAGPSRITIFYKTTDADGTEDSTPVTVTLASATNQVAWGFSVVLAKSAGGNTWDAPVFTTGTDTTGVNANYSATGAANPGVTTGDVVVCACCIPSDTQTTAASQNITQTGITFTQTHSGNLESALGNDIGGHVTAATVSGTASAAPSYAVTFTSSTTAYGPMMFVRFRETAGATPTSLPPWRRRTRGLVYR